MNEHELSIRLDDPDGLDAFESEFLEQLEVPADDMWATFACAAKVVSLSVGDDTAGFARLDDHQRLLRFYVTPRFQHLAPRLLRHAIDELGVKVLMVATSDPVFLGPGLDSASSVKPHTLLFTLAHPSKGAGLEGLRLAQLDDHRTIVDFQESTLGAPRAFLEAYTQERLERGEIRLYERGARIVSVGELRRDKWVEGVTHLGLIVHEDDRGEGIGTRMLQSLVDETLASDWTPLCSTEVGNVGAKMAIERAGFRARHRLLIIDV